MARGRRRVEAGLRSRRALLLGAVIVVPVMLVVIGLVMAGLLGGTEPEPRPQTVAGTPIPPSSTPPVAPETHPTRGEYVPPRPPPTTRPPKPVVTTTPKATPSPSRTAERPSRICPREWLEIPHLKRWCERNGFRTR